MLTTAEVQLGAGGAIHVSHMAGRDLEQLSQLFPRKSALVGSWNLEQSQDSNLGTALQHLDIPSGVFNCFNLRRAWRVFGGTYGVGKTKMAYHSGL